MAASYATQAEYEAYVPGWTTTDATALAALLAQATRDVDYCLGPRGVITTGTYAGLKLDPTTLDAYERTALSRATCAQAEYLMAVDPEALAAGRVLSSVSGPDFTMSYATPSTGASGRPSAFAPKLRVELAPIAHLRRLTAALR